VLVVFLFHFHFFDSIVRLIIDYDVYHVSEFVNEDQKLTKRNIYLINIMIKIRLTKRLQSVQHFRVAIGSAVTGIFVVDIVVFLSSCAGEI
jgi:hypothetical protein